MTALAHAVENDHHDVARFLCMKGADTNHIDRVYLHCELFYAVIYVTVTNLICLF